MDVISAYREMGSYRGAAAVCQTTPKTVKRIIDRHEAGAGPPARKERGHNYDPVTELVEERIRATSGRIAAKRLLPAAQAAGYTGSARNFRRLISTVPAAWRRGNHRSHRSGGVGTGRHADHRLGQPGWAARVLRVPCPGQDLFVVVASADQLALGPIRIRPWA
jgi:hypothetical protein